MKIVVEKEALIFDGISVNLPCALPKIQAVLGEGKYLNYNPETGIEYQVWDDAGIWAWLDETKTNITGLGFCMKPFENQPVSSLFQGELYIEKKIYTDQKWKSEEYSDCRKTLKIGNYVVDQLNFAEEEWDMPERIVIDYIRPKKKTNKYKQVKNDGPILSFDNFNFKLLVIEKLMYEKKLLRPEFDIYEFAQEYSRREIDIDEEGYEPIKEARRWFERFEIPQKYAPEITELFVGGGNRVYQQIYPFWDGEDELFDLEAVSQAEISQFDNLKKISSYVPFNEDVTRILNDRGIEIDII